MPPSAAAVVTWDRSEACADFCRRSGEESLGGRMGSMVEASCECLLVVEDRDECGRPADDSLSGEEVPLRLAESREDRLPALSLVSLMMHGHSSSGAVKAVSASAARRFSFDNAVVDRCLGLLSATLPGKNHENLHRNQFKTPPEEAGGFSS